MIRQIKKREKLRAQAIIEGPVAFLLSFLIFIFIVEFALYFKSIHANQTFADDVSANVSAYAGSNPKLCENPDIDLLDTINDRAQRYLDGRIRLEIINNSEEILTLNWGSDSTLLVNIICQNSGGYIVRSDYIFKGFFALRFGHTVSSISSVQTPKF